MTLAGVDLGLLRTPLVAACASGAVAGLVLLLAARPWRGRAAPTTRWGIPLALGLASAAAFVATRGWPAPWPRSSIEWLFHLGLAGALLGCAEFHGSRAMPLIRALVAVAVPLVLLEFMRARHWDSTEAVLWNGGLAAWLFTTWTLLARLERGAGAAPLGHAVGQTLGTALGAAAVGLAGGSLFGPYVGALAVALGACAVLAAWRPDGGLGAAGVAPLALLSCGIVWEARFLYELTQTSFVLLSLAPVSPCLALVVPAARRRARTLVAALGPPLLAGAAALVERAAVESSAYY